MTFFWALMRTLTGLVACGFVSFFSWRLGRRQALKEAAWEAEMWMPNTYGIHHKCNEHDGACAEIGRLADKLREMEKGRDA